MLCEPESVNEVMVGVCVSNSESDITNWHNWIVIIWDLKIIFLGMLFSSAGQLRNLARKLLSRFREALSRILDGTPLS
jgi:hypothetical protein